MKTLNKFFRKKRPDTHDQLFSPNHQKSATDTWLHTLAYFTSKKCYFHHWYFWI